VNCFMIVYVV